MRKQVLVSVALAAGRSVCVMVPTKHEAGDALKAFKAAGITSTLIVPNERYEERNDTETNCLIMSHFGIDALTVRRAPWNRFRLILASGHGKDSLHDPRLAIYQRNNLFRVLRRQCN